MPDVLKAKRCETCRRWLAATETIAAGVGSCHECKGWRVTFETSPGYFETRWFYGRGAKARARYYAAHGRHTREALTE